MIRDFPVSRSKTAATRASTANYLPASRPNNLYHTSITAENMPTLTRIYSRLYSLKQGQNSPKSPEYPLIPPVNTFGAGWVRIGVAMLYKSGGKQARKGAGANNIFVSGLGGAARLVWSQKLMLKREYCQKGNCEPRVVAQFLPWCSALRWCVASCLAPETVRLAVLRAWGARGSSPPPPVRGHHSARRGVHA